jgi:hypothetical protein
LVVAGLLGLACLIPQMTVNVATTGSIGGRLSAFPYWHEMRTVPVYLGRELFAPGSGLLVLFPVCAIGMLGLGWLVTRRDSGHLAAAFLVGFGCLLAVNSCAEAPGVRRYTCAFPALVLGVAGVIDGAWRVRAWRPAVVGVLAGCCLRNVLLLVLLESFVIPHSVFNSSVRERPEVLAWSIALLL